MKKSENPTQNALYQREMKKRNKLMAQYKSSFPEKWNEMHSECFPEGTKRIQRKAWEKWEKIIKTDLEGPVSKEVFDPIPMDQGGEEPEPQDKLDKYKSIKLFNPRSLEKDPRKMSYAELAEYVIQLGIDKWTDVPDEFKLSSGYLQDNRVYAFHRWKAHKKFLDLSRDQQALWDFNKNLNDARLKRIIEEAEDRARQETANVYYFGENGPVVRLFNGMTIDRDVVRNSPKKIEGNYRFQIGHIYAFYSEERNFLTILKVEGVHRDDDLESDRLVIKGTNYRGAFIKFYYRLDSTMALELS